MCWSLKKRTFLEFHEVDSPAFLSSGASSTILIRLYNISRQSFTLLPVGSFSSTTFSRAGGLPHTTAQRHASYLGAHVPGKPFPAFSVLTATGLSELGFLLLVQVLPGKEGKGKRQESFNPLQQKWLQ